MDINDLIAQANPGQNEEAPENSSTNNLFTQTFGENGEGARYTPAVQTQEEFDASPEGQTLERLSDQLKTGGIRFARDMWFKLRAANEQKLQEARKKADESQAELDAQFGDDADEDELLARFAARNNSSLTPNQLAQNAARSKQLADTIDANNRNIELKIAENAAAAEFQEANTGISPATDKFFSPDATAKDMLGALGDDGFGLVGDLLAQNAPGLGLNVAGGVATGGSSLAVKVGAQAAIEGGIVNMQEFADRLIRDSGQDIDFKDPEIVRKLFENREAIEAAYNTGDKAGGVGFGGAALSTFLAMKGIIPLTKLASKPVKRIAEVGAQTAAQGAVGVGTEVGIAAAADRELTRGEAVAGGLLGVASGTIDAATNRVPDAAVESPQTTEGAQVDIALSSQDKLNTNLDKIYGDSDRAISELDIPTARKDEALDAYEQAKNDDAVSPEQLDELRTAAIVEQQDFDAEVARSREEPAVTPVDDIAQAAETTPADDPQLKAFREKRDGPRSEFDVPESDPRSPAARDYLDEENLIFRDAARDRFNNPEENNGQSNDQHVQQGQVSDQRVSEVRAGDSNVQQGREQTVQENAVQELSEVENGPAAGSSDSSSQDSTLTDFNNTVAGDIQAARARDRQAVSDEVDRIVADSNENTTAVNNINDLAESNPDLHRQIRGIENAGEGVTVGAVFDPDTDRMYLFKDNLDSPQQVRNVALHEASHAARLSDTKADKNARADLLELHKELGGDEGVVQYARDNGIDLSSYADRFADFSDDQRAFQITDELLAQVHGNESGPRKQIARRALSKIENLARDFTGQEVDLFKRTGGRDEVDGSVIRQIASSERTIRNNKIIGSKYGVVAAPKDLIAREVLPWTTPDWLPNSIVKLSDSNAGIRANEWWRKNIRADRGLGSEGLRTLVQKDAAIRDSNVKVHQKIDMLNEVMKKVPKADRVAVSKRMAEYLKDPADKGKGLTDDQKNIADGMRADIDNGSIAVHDVVLTDQLRAKIWKLNQKDNAKYNPKGEDSLVTRIENWKKRPADRDDPEKEEYFKLIPQDIKNHIKLMEIISDKVGAYLRRSYRAHSDATYRAEVMNDKKLVDSYSRDLIDMDHENSKEARKVTSAKRNLDRIKNQASPQQKTLDKAQSRLDKAEEALLKRPQMDIKEARATLSQMLERASDNESINMVSGGNLMKINKNSFKAQTLQDPRMRRILGEHDDVATVYAQSVNTLDGIAASHQMQKALFPVLQKMGFISQTKSRDAIAKDPIEKPMMEGDPMSLMNGFFTTPVVDAAVANSINGFQLSKNKVLASLVKSSAAVNYGKTILSPPTHVGNYVSNFFIRGANGHLLTGGLNKETAFLKDVLFKKDPEAIAEYRKLTRLGVVSETIDINELADILGQGKGATRQRFEAWLDDPEVMSMIDVANSADLTKLSLKNAGKLKRVVESLYGAEDDLFKIAAFRRERDLATKYKGLKGAEADDYAAQRVRDGYLMYSELNQLVKDIKNAPGIGVFVSFPAALIKAAKGQIRLAAQDLIDEDLPSSVRVQRSIGLVGAYGATSAAAATSGLLTGIGSEEEDAWRQSLPEWSRQNDILFLGREDNGDPIYIDLNRFDPFSYFETGMRELTKSNDDTFLGVNTNLYDMAKSYVSPFVGLNIMTGALVESATGIDLTSKNRITNPALSNEAQGMDRILDFAKTVMPGFATQGLNIFDAAVNDKKWYGSENSLDKAALKAFGLNIGRMDRDVSMRFFASSSNRELSNAKNIISRAMGDLSNSANYPEIKKALFAGRNAQMKTYKNVLKMIEVMRDLELSDDKISGMLKNNGHSKKSVKKLMAGEFPDLTVSGREGSRAHGNALILADSEEDTAQEKAERNRRVELLRRAHDEWLESDENLGVL